MHHGLAQEQMQANGRACLQHIDITEEPGPWTLRHREVAKRESPAGAQARLQVGVEELERSGSQHHQTHHVHHVEAVPTATRARERASQNFDARLRSRERDKDIQLQQHTTNLSTPPRGTRAGEEALSAHPPPGLLRHHSTAATDVAHVGARGRDCSLSRDARGRDSNSRGGDKQSAAGSLAQAGVGVSNEPRRVGMYITVVSGVAEAQVCVCVCVLCVCVCCVCVCVCVIY